MSRIPLFPIPDAMTPEQERVYKEIISGPRGGIVGPLRALLHSPELADKTQHLGALLRFETSLPARLKELAILVTGRRWNSQVEWYVHAKAALKQGLDEGVVEAIKYGREPVFSNQDEFIVYEYTRQLQIMGTVSQVTYDQAKEHLKAVGVVELTALIGYYTMVSMTLNAHEIPLPDGVTIALEQVSPVTVDNREFDCGLTMLAPGVFRK